MLHNSGIIPNFAANPYFKYIILIYSLHLTIKNVIILQKKKR